jgi:hypothetical protein
MIFLQSDQPKTGTAKYRNVPRGVVGTETPTTLAGCGGAASPSGVLADTSLPTTFGRSRPKAMMTFCRDYRTAAAGLVRAPNGYTL